MAATARKSILEDTTLSKASISGNSSISLIDTSAAVLSAGELAELPPVNVPVQNPVIAVGGHRGLGQNFISETSQSDKESMVRENTIDSFLLASGQGADFIEFDVQVTQDGVPVIWHDDVIVYRDAQGNINSKQISEISLDEFKSIGHNQLLRTCQQSKRLKAWRCDVGTELPTLDEVFREIPEAVGFDIEIKMTTADSQSATEPTEVNRVVTAVLREVREWEASSYRRMIYSTFDPDVALALKHRQSSLPVFLLADGQTHYADSRRCGLPSALAFAELHRLDGLVLESTALRSCLELLRKADLLGLHIVTYGEENDDPEWVMQQQSLGIQAAIVDDVPNVVQCVKRAPRSPQSLHL